MKATINLEISDEIVDDMRKRFAEAGIAPQQFNLRNEQIRIINFDEYLQNEKYYLMLVATLIKISKPVSPEPQKR